MTKMHVRYSDIVYYVTKEREQRAWSRKELKTQKDGKRVQDNVCRDV